MHPWKGNLRVTAVIGIIAFLAASVALVPMNINDLMMHTPIDELSFPYVPRVPYASSLIQLELLLLPC